MQLDVENVLGEVEGARSLDCIWDFSKLFYGCCLGLVYNLLSCFFAIWIAAGWGVQFACVAFENIWCLTPCFKMFSLNMSRCGRIVRSCANCCIKPPCWACGFICVHFKKPGYAYNPLDNIETPVRRARIVQAPKKNKVEPQKPKSKKKEEEAKGKEPPPAVPAAIIVAPVAEQKELKPDIYLGDADKMKRSVKRQLMLWCAHLLTGRYILNYVKYLY